MLWLDMAEIKRKDGRHARRDANREKIVRAFLDLVRAGVSEPGAHTIAHKAGVSPRTVFRCYEDVESLYRELAAKVRADLLSRAFPELKTRNRSHRLERFLKNQVAACADHEHLRFALEGHRRRFDAVDDETRALARIERERLTLAINPDNALNPDLFEALNALVSFDMWRRLRIEQGLSKARAGRVMVSSAQAVFAAAMDGEPDEVSGQFI